jgi:T5SS/PEP-CTERM-associated repeat protein
MKSARILLASMAGLAAMWSTQVLAAPVTWNTGVTGDWGVGSNWSSNAVPVINGSSPDVVSVLSGTVTYSGTYTNTNGDFSDDTTVTVSGAATTWTQSTNNWFKVGDSGASGTLDVENGAVFDPSNGGNQFIGNGGQGTLLVDGGTFKANTLQLTGDTADSLVSTVTVQNGGVIDTNSDLLINNALCSFVMNGGTINVAGQFHPRGPGDEVELNGGTLNANLVSFDGDATASADLNGTDVVIANGTFFNGIYSTGGYLNFTSNSTSVIDLLGGATAADADVDINTGRVRFRNATSPLSDFVISPITNGVEISLAPVPEPASLSVVVFAGMALLPRRRRV